MTRLLSFAFVHDKFPLTAAFARGATRSIAPLAAPRGAIASSTIRDSRLSPSPPASDVVTALARPTMSTMNQTNVTADLLKVAEEENFAGEIAISEMAEGQPAIN